MDLATVWFVIIALFWLGFLFLEGFDFGVGMLLPVLGRDDAERRALIATIGPVWDANEVWLIVAAGATFAAFPGWYAALLSTLYLPVVLVLLALIGRGVAFEFRGKVNSARWRRTWDALIVAGSWIPALGVGFILSAMVFGLPVGPDGDRVGSAPAVFGWQAGLGALAIAGYALVHGAVFVALKTDGELRDRARRLALRVGAVALAPLGALLLLLRRAEGSHWTWIPLSVSVLGAIVALGRLAAGREGQAFAALSAVITGAVVTLFGALHPNVLTSTVDENLSLTIADTASSPYTLAVMSWIAAFATPAVLIYQGWAYWVFRKRIRSGGGGRDGGWTEEQRRRASAEQRTEEATIFCGRSRSDHQHSAH